jgi:hypothetical protein
MSRAPATAASSSSSSTGRKHTVGAIDSILPQVNVFGMLPVVPMLPDRLLIVSTESWGESLRQPIACFGVDVCGVRWLCLCGHK